MALIGKSLHHLKVIRNTPCTGTTAGTIMVFAVDHHRIVGTGTASPVLDGSFQLIGRISCCVQKKHPFRPVEQIQHIVKLGFNPMEFMGVLGQIFQSESRSGFFPMGQKMLLYKITDQKLSMPHTTELSTMSAYFKQQVYMVLFGEYLNKHYPPKIFMELD